MPDAARKSWAKILGRYAFLVGCACVVGGLLAVGVSSWQDWASRQKRIAELLELEAQTQHPPSAENFYPIEMVSRPPLVSGMSGL